MRARAWTRPDDVRAALPAEVGIWRAADRVRCGARLGAAGFPAARADVQARSASRLGEVQEWAGEWERAGQGAARRVQEGRWQARRIQHDPGPGLDRRLRAGLGPARRSYAEVGRFTELAEADQATPARGWLPWLAPPPHEGAPAVSRWDRRYSPPCGGSMSGSGPGMYLRQVDVPGVDTKFIERHRGVLAQLLDLQLDRDRIDRGRRRISRAATGSAGKPGYVRFRCADLSGPGSAASARLPSALAEFTAAPPGIRRVYVVENEITYLAFPPRGRHRDLRPRATRSPCSNRSAWLADIDVVYWGDIDTHGFAILDRLRQRFPHARSMLMDRGDAAGAPHPVGDRAEPFDRRAWTSWIPKRRSCTSDLMADAFGPSVRLEQERVSFAAIEQATLNI